MASGTQLFTRLMLNLSRLSHLC